MPRQPHAESALKALVTGVVARCSGVPGAPPRPNPKAGAKKLPVTTATKRVRIAGRRRVAPRPSPPLESQ
jgi:hypothetical protein